jgi:pimeloyl-ACP methyl ester carboxylesterase
MPESQPTVVLVHGAFADAGSYAKVVPELLADGLPVVVPAVPNRSLIGDAAYIASVIRQIDGPVILVGHSYGGAVITVAGVEDNVRALVYLSAYCLEEGESLGELQGRFPDSPLAAALVYKKFPTDGDPGTDVFVDVAKFPEIFAADVDQDLAKILAVGSGRWPRWPLPRRPAPPPGRPSQPGDRSPATTRPSTPTSSDSATSAAG